MSDEQQGSPTTADCMDCGDTVEVTALSEVGCSGSCARVFKVCEMCKDEPYTCVDCDQEPEDDDEDAEQGGTD